MKAVLKGKVRSIERESGQVRLLLDATGKVDTKNISAQEVSTTISLRIKELVADTMKIGTTFTITISDEENGDELV